MTDIRLNFDLLGASEVSANLYFNLRASVLGRLRDYCGYLWGARYLKYT